MNPSLKRGLPKNIHNINGYLIDNYNKILDLQENMKVTQKMLEERFATTEIAEKDRIINNYALLLAFARCFDFYDRVLEPIIQQVEMQVVMMSDNDIDTAIKTAISIALNWGWSGYINEEEKALVIEMSVDSLRYQKRKIEDLYSQIKIVNHHFRKWDGHVFTDSLHVPLEYIFKKPTLHTLFNKLLAKEYRWRSLDSKSIALVLKQYAESNWYDKEFFTQLVPYADASKSRQSPGYAGEGIEEIRKDLQ